jgi:hypothetical protein
LFCATSQVELDSAAGGVLVVGAELATLVMVTELRSASESTALPDFNTTGDNVNEITSTRQPQRGLP